MFISFVPLKFRVQCTLNVYSPFWVDPFESSNDSKWYTYFFDTYARFGCLSYEHYGLFDSWTLYNEKFIWEMDKKKWTKEETKWQSDKKLPNNNTPLISYILKSMFICATFVIIFYWCFFFLFGWSYKKNSNNNEHTHSGIKKKIMCIFKTKQLNNVSWFGATVHHVSAKRQFHHCLSSNYCYTARLFQVRRFVFHLFLVWSRMTEIHVLMKKV